MSLPAPTEETARTLLARPGFSKLLAYRIFAMLSYQVVAVTVGWHIYEVTRNPFSLGLVGLAEVLPFFCVAPFAGYLVDHLPRRRLGMAACAGLVATALVLCAVALGWLPFHGVWPIYAAIALTGMVRAFLSPIYNALFARVLERHQFARGAGLGSVFFQAGMVVGPALGGVLVGWGGKGVAYGVATGFALMAMACLATLKVSEPVHTGPAAPIFRSIAEGARFVIGNRIMVGAMALDMFSVLLGGVVAMLPAFLQEILHYGPEGLGILRAAPALGSIAVGLWLARHPLQKHAGRVLLFAVAGFGLCVIGFGLSHHFWLSALILLFYGAFDGVSVVVRSTILQLATPEEMRGRVSSINGIFISSSNELGAFYAGTMAKWLGLVPAVVLGGFAVLSVAGITAWKNPTLRRLNLRDLQ
ncbi:multidrug transporter [Stenotrophomonas chelatiphaga]|uniref:Multidrug transporter n=1 Tax=Stenotrophomonas chelatiphaga TaxID=517011 RepID=A0A0R0CX60_9GAMM|nr:MULTISPECIES: MFS transporter [Stenotrophomonas]KRG70356.1 multidrug transporter [Stenotrophomonas chelatiphaga]MCS4232424.1 MFS family permease [Stenotrophomonas chelatiphaga]MDR6093939.1 MFS family permease [Stenotrophomonas sp. SORGH_AS_0321]ROQ42318.1 putative MFS family arabinose efflux permease [Stenotrophomonas maltophilia]